MLRKLDKQVGEAKGWKYYDGTGPEKSQSYRGDISPLPEGFLLNRDGSEYHIDDSVCNWSTDDRDAFELVDEWVALAKGNVVWITAEKEGSRVNFIREYFEKTGGILVSMAHERTRPEAICRAYISAMEWKKGRKDGKPT